MNSSTQKEENKKAREELKRTRSLNPEVGKTLENEMLKRTYSLGHEVSKVCTVEVSPSRGSKILVENTIFPRCDTESEPVIWTVDDNNGQNSDKDESSVRKYTFGYKICTGNVAPKNGKSSRKIHAEESIQKSKQELPLGMYDFIYVSQDKQVLFTTHKIISRALLFSKQLEDERKLVYKDDTYGYDFFGEDFSTRKDLFDQITKKSEYKLQWLIPANDFPFALWRKTTYHYLNIDLMHRKLIALWDHIGDKIRNDIQYLPGELKIYTGAFKMPKLENLANQLPVKKFFEYEIPHFWIKFLHNRTREKPATDIQIVEDQAVTRKKPQSAHSALVIIANNYLDENVSVFIEKYLCPTNYCERFAKMKAPEVYKYVRCCEATEGTSIFLHLRQIYEELLIIRDLTEARRNIK
ncbi:uncharacterized protein LOC135838192 [Planococcus citri]|uniref:uncharacterized protein LOC135838192 n=1 Tax=Planococcus citri TaxID=170843 RepID=UPI0031F9DBB6